MELFISDLDGTLLNSRQQLSERTIAIINRLIAQGVTFSIATARSIDSAGPIIAPIRFRLPIIVHNGVYVYDLHHGKTICANYLDCSIAAELIKIYQKHGVSPFVFTSGQNGVKKIYYTGIFNAGEEHYYKSRIAAGDGRFRLINDFSRSLTEKIISIIIIGDYPNLAPVHDELSAVFDLTLHFAQDIYSKAYWLEITHKLANKRDAVRFLKTHLNAGSIICFGDNLNDAPMFEIADQCYAVNNGVSSIKKIATGIIKSNDEDGVACFLEERFRHFLRKDA